MFEYFGSTLDTIVSVLKLVWRFAPLWLPLALISAFWQQWMAYRRAQYIQSKEPVLLEIRVPKEVSKSPAAMELALGVFYATGGEGTWYDKYWKGGVRPWFSLELVSIEGQVKFFIWTWKDSVKGIQNSLYAQYPTVEVTEVPDYTLAFMYDKNKADLYAAEFALTKIDPYPIKTYIDYGLDKDPKEEFKIDPITQVLEYLGGLGKGEQAWIQILLRAHKKEDPKNVSLLSQFTKPEDVFDVGKKVKEWREPTDKWKDDVKTEIASIIKKRKIRGEDPEDNKINLTPVEKDTIEALERSTSKTGYDVGIRALYLAEKEYFNNGHKGALNGVLAQYSSGYLNGFKKAFGTSHDYWFQDPFGKKLPKMKKNMFEAYRLRGYFHAPHSGISTQFLFKEKYKRKPFILNSEELATIFHFPGGVSETPTLGRIESRKSEPPINLPS
ncbi:MAG: hypothetical protein AAB458_00910 [Patescibacteria group bacterium]